MTNLKNWSKNGLLFGLFLVPFIALIKIDALFFPFIAGKAFAFRILIEILFITLLVFLIYDKDTSLKFGNILVFLFIFIITFALATYFAENSYLSFWGNYERMEGFIGLVHLFFYFLILIALLRADELWVRFWFSFLFVGVLMGFYLIFEVVHSQLSVGSLPRLGALFGNPTYLSAFTLFLFFINLYLYSMGRLKFLIFLPIIFLQLMVIYLTGTRGSVLGLLGGLVIIALLFVAKGRESHPKLFWYSLTTLFVIVTVITSFLIAKDSNFVQSSQILSRFANISLANVETQDSRLLVWPIAVEGFKDRPLMGWGQENFIYVFNQYYDPSLFDREQFFDKAHNLVLDWLISGGIFGLLAYLSIYAVLLYSIWKSSQIAYIGQSILTGLVFAYFVQNLFVFDHLYGYVLFFTLLAYINHLSSQKSLSFVLSNTGRTVKIVIFLLGSALVATSLYFANYKPIRASLSLTQALGSLNKENGRQEFVTHMESALSYNGFGNPEIALQLAHSAPNFLQPDTPENVQRSFFNLTDRALDKHLEQDPNDVRARLVYGLFLSRFDQNERSLAQYQKALELSPKRQSTWLTIGAIYLDQGNYTEAVKYFKQAHELEPRFTKPRVWYGISLVYVNEKEEAKKILAPVPLETLVADDRLINAHIDMGNHQELVPLFAERVKMNPNDPQANVSLAVALLKSGNFKEAAKVLESFLARNPGFEKDLRFYINEIRAGRDPSK